MYLLLELFIIFFLIFQIANLVCTIIGKWRCLSKAGEKGWKALIPFYNWIALYKISGMSPYWIGIYFSYFIMVIVLKCLSNVIAKSYLLVEDSLKLLLSATAVTLILALLYMVIHIIWCVKFCKSYKHGVGFVFGMIFVPSIFLMIIGFDRSKYIKENLI